MTNLRELFEKPRRIHFVGIGGSGIFPIVQILQTQGHKIQGSDNNPGDTIELECKMGATVYIGHKADQIAGADLVIYSAAIQSDNPELVAAREQGIPTIERSEVLGYITGLYSDCVCVSGTHGKTTTTSLLTQVLMGAGMDPTAVIGGKLPLIGGSGRAGATSVMTCEACEYVDTFLHLFPDISIILNIDADHLDYFGTLENIIKSFRKFGELTTRLIVANGDDANTMRAVSGLDKRIVTFGWGEHNDYFAANVQTVEPTHTVFDLMHHGEVLANLSLSVPGRHNILNALAACTAALQLGVTPRQLVETVPGFRGAGRRFEILGKVRGITIADDYAHHPAELEVTLRTAEAMGFNRVWAVFQPFTYSRTSLLLDDFSRVLSIPERVVMSEIMGAREVNTYNIYTRDLAAKIPGSVWFEDFGEIAEYVMSNAVEGDLVLTLGCGDIYKCARMMLAEE